MARIIPKCIKSVDGLIIYCKCGNYLVRHGKTRTGKQRFYCKLCKFSQVETYQQQARHATTNSNIVSLTKEGCDIRSTARLLKISSNTVISRIKKIASEITQPPISIGKIFERPSPRVDELRTYAKRKENLIWIVSAFERERGKIVSFNVGRRTNKTLKVVIGTLKNLGCKAIYTDKLNNYKSLIDKKIHCTKLRSTNRIERAHLTIRTHIKRLNRKTITFSKNVAMLIAVPKIYFWG